MLSTWQLTSVLAVFFSIAAFLWLMRRHFARRYGVPQARFRWLSGGFVLLGVVFVLVSTLVMRSGAATVIFRTRLEGTVGMREGAPAVLRVARFEPMHAGRPHQVSLEAIPERPDLVRGPIRVRLSLISPSDSALADTELVLPVRTRRFWMTARPGWATGGVPFRPYSTGTHALRLIPLNPGIRRLEVKITELP